MTPAEFIAILRTQAADHSDTLSKPPLPAPVGPASATADAMPAASRGMYLKPPASAAAVHAMQTAARRDLGEPVPDDYVALLRLTDGAQFDAAYFKSAEHLVAENLDVPRPEIIVLGNEGNTTEFVFDRRDRRFHAINLGFPNERFASFDSFADLLVTFLRERGMI